MESLAKSTGLSTEEFVKFRSLMSGGGVDIDEFARATANIGIRLQGSRAVIARRVAEEPPLDEADTQDRLTQARVGNAVTRATAAAKEEIARRQLPLNIAGAALGLDEATQLQAAACRRSAAPDHRRAGEGCG